MKAQRGFACGDKKIVALLFANDCFHVKLEEVPTTKGYKLACDKLPSEYVETLVNDSHQSEFSEFGESFHGLKVIIPDGTLCIVPRVPETIKKFGLGSGSTGDAYYPQARAVGFYEPTTGTFEQFRFGHYKTPERSFMLDHAKENSAPTLYMADAGFNGTGHIAIVKNCYGHDVLARSKEQSNLEKKFRKSGKRSATYEIKITNVHLRNHPEFKHLLGETVKLRFVKTRGTTKLRSMILITTLLDEEAYPWEELSKLYLQRYKVELAIRHLKSKICIEKIKKIKLSRIMQLLHSAVLLFNMSAMLRNVVKRPSLMPERKGAKVYCLELCSDFIDLVFVATINPGDEMEDLLNRCVKAIASCYSINKPWRTCPRICQFPSSVFTRQKTSAKNEEHQKVKFLKPEYEILGNEYGML